jgi:type II secretory pathway component PulJ
MKRTNKKAFMIIELMTALAVMGSLLLVMAWFYRDTLVEVPRSYRAVQANTSVLDAIDHIRRDVETCKSLPAKADGFTADQYTLIIAEPNGTVVYRLENGVLHRTACGMAIPGHVLHGQDARATSWKLATARLEFAAKPNEVVIRSWVEQKVRGKSVRRMENSRVFFAALAAGGAG